MKRKTKRKQKSTKRVYYGMVNPAHDEIMRLLDAMFDLNAIGGVRDTIYRQVTGEVCRQVDDGPALMVRRAMAEHEHR